MSVLHAILSACPPGFFDDLAMELGEMGRLRAHGQLSIRFSLVDGQIRNYAIIRTRHRLDGRHRTSRLAEPHREE